jgi:hypothetical protein
VRKISDAVDKVVFAPDDGWKYHPNHVEQFPDINKLFNVASSWIYDYIGILLGVHYILHISRIMVKINGNRQQDKETAAKRLYDQTSPGQEHQAHAHN